MSRAASGPPRREAAHGISASSWSSLPVDGACSARLLAWFGASLSLDQTDPLVVVPASKLHHLGQPTIVAPTRHSSPLLSSPLHSSSPSSSRSRSARHSPLYPDALFILLSSLLFFAHLVPESSSVFLTSFVLRCTFGLLIKISHAPPPHCCPLGG